nr:MAG TPA: hypothetical protein [Caudoviricetes sp.]
MDGRYSVCLQSGFKNARQLNSCKMLIIIS